jgi:hypothetical protein
MRLPFHKAKPRLECEGGMTDLITTISGHFGKSLILGAMLPAVLFVVLWVVFVAPLVPPGWSIPALFPIFESQWPVITASFAAIVLTGLLYSFNVPIIRLFEGYPWKNSWVGGWGVRRYVAALANEQARLKGMRTLLVAIKDRQKGKTYQDIHEEFSRIGRRLTHEFPGHSSRVRRLTWATSSAAMRTTRSCSTIWRRLHCGLA